MVQMENDKDETRIWVNLKLLDDVETAYPETKGMTYTGRVEWALRKLLTRTRKEEA